ncbi:hypothetical protein GGR57DRAFT_286089 [Xylariaceae sp. FL1272]|nr:hypothetical protein GGR57DRAFT_286089 [Xylariaceae sp. FL1272]
MAFFLVVSGIVLVFMTNSPPSEMATKILSEMPTVIAFFLVAMLVGVGFMLGLIRKSTITVSISDYLGALRDEYLMV